MVFDFKVLERLPPDQRVNALQRLRDELRVMIEKRKKEIDQSNREIIEAETLLQRAEDDLAVLLKVQTPEQKAVRIDDLFFKDEKAKKSNPARTLDEDIDNTVVNRLRDTPKKEDLNYLTRPSAFDELRRGYDDDKAERDNPYKRQTGGAEDNRQGYSHNAPFRDEREKDEKKYKN